MADGGGNLPECLCLSAVKTRIVVSGTVLEDCSGTLFRELLVVLMPAVRICVSVKLDALDIFRVLPVQQCPRVGAEEAVDILLSVFGKAVAVIIKKDTVVEGDFSGLLIDVRVNSLIRESRPLSW